jgi:hypothetical protein
MGKIEWKDETQRSQKLLHRSTILGSNYYSEITRLLTDRLGSI